MRTLKSLTLAAAAALAAAPALPQPSGNPYAEPVATEGGAIVVDLVEVATLPDIGGDPADMRKLVHEPGTDRIFVNDQRGPIYTLDGDGGVTEYLDVDAESWGVDVDTSWREVGVQSYAFHPEFAEAGAAGYGRLYVWVDTPNTSPAADFGAGGDEVSHHTVLLEFTAEDASAARYDGGAPRELARFAQPFRNHNGGDIAFNPLAASGDDDYGLLYVGVADGGAGGDPLNLAQDMSRAFGKILRIDPLGSDGPTGEYGIPGDNPFAGDGDTLGEIYALGLRNPQHFAWDPATDTMFVTDIGQNAVEELSTVTRGADLGWNDWEGSVRYDGGADLSGETWRDASGVTYPIAEYDHAEPLLGGRAAVTGLVVYRDDAIPALADRVLFGDLPSGEIFHFDADDLPDGGKDALRRVLFRADGEPQRFLDVVRARNRADGRTPAERTDVRLYAVPDGRVFVLNKHDGVLRAVPAR